MRKITMLLMVALAALALSATAVFAAVTFDPETGTGFVGKGDVQLALGLNNAQLQAQASSLSFTASSTSVTSWTCDRDAGPQTNERTNTTTTQGLVNKVERVKNQITGFTLSGYTGTPTETTDGPAAGSCPTGWTAIDLVTTPGTTTLYVNGVPLQ